MALGSELDFGEAGGENDWSFAFPKSSANNLWTSVSSQEPLFDKGGDRRIRFCELDSSFRSALIISV